MKCPIDNETLVMTERSGVEIDYCPKCRGVWLDRGELEKIIDRSLPAVAPTPRSDPRYPERDESHGKDRDDDHNRYQDDEHGRQYPRKKKGSFLGELFDF